eukprot:TRINITY_DN17159_c0_g1_i1.p1 TRINITY_DN17159_c0_g1~~TRINITY_DN17159_c0_g1_i1.p1  ORF type:complete len:1349 (+),score=270.59 TRINITY_DN17159_c0_g1_i1:35-4081(+)
MGCGASAQPEYKPVAEPEASPSQEEVDVAYVASQDEYTSDPSLPFARYDTTAVCPELSSGDEVYFKFLFTGSILSTDGETVTVIDSSNGACGDDLDDDFVAEEAKDSVWAIEMVTDGEVFPPPPLTDGVTVRVKHVATGVCLEAPGDMAPLKVSAPDPDCSAQKFTFYKHGRPLRMKHRDACFLQSHLYNFVEREGDCSVRARRWRRGPPMTISVLKKRVIDTTTTELARQMQYEAFDLDGNKSISKSELYYMMRRIVPGVSEEDVEAIAGACDPDGTGSILFDGFAAWADNGGCSEELLQWAEVLGNVAQRCNDALFEERSLIEALTLTHSKDTQMIQKKYQAYFGEDLAAAITKKASEQDGWIMSNYWKVCMEGLLKPRVDLWTKALNDAMRGFGTDESTLTALVVTIPEDLRAKIFVKYEEDYGKNLLTHIQSETSSSYKKVLEYQAMAPEDCRARLLWDAMNGMGTDEAQIIRVVCQLDIPERRIVKEVYASLFQRDLVEHIKSETSGEFQKALSTMLEAEETDFDLEECVDNIHTAMDCWGTDEEALIRLICRRSPKQMEEVNKLFMEKYGPRSLLEWVESETSNHFKATLSGCIRHPMVQLAHSVRYCIEGFGTDERGLITLLVHLPDFKKDALRKTYQLQFGRDLMKDIMSDCSGHFEKALLSLLKPAPQVWAEALKGAMKGLGTYDELLINFLIIAKDDMSLVRKSFEEHTGQKLVDWIAGECSGDYMRTLVSLCQRNSECSLSMLPLYWAQRCKDLVGNTDTLKDIFVSMPAVVLKRGTEVFQTVYNVSLVDEVKRRCEEESSMFCFTNWWKHAMLRLLEMPVELYVKGLYDAMQGFGTDEYTLTALLCTLPENLHQEVHMKFEAAYGKKLVDFIESELSFSFKNCLVAQAMSFPESRAKALHKAVSGIGTDEMQLIRIIVLSSFQERQLISDAYLRMYEKELIPSVIESETSGMFKEILTAIMESASRTIDDNVNFDADVESLNAAMEGSNSDMDGVVRVLASKTHEQIDTLNAKYEEKYGISLRDVFNDESYGWADSIFGDSSFRSAVLCLLRNKKEQLAYSVRDCIQGWGTDETGLITCLTHLSERERNDLVMAYAEIEGGGDLYQAIKSDCSGDFETALLALVKPAPVVMAEAITSSIKGLGTSDNLLINWMCIAKERMDEVRDAFREIHGQELADWIDGDCSGDYKDTLIRLARRECMRFLGSEVALTIPAPVSKEETVIKFNKEFNRLCAQKKADPGTQVVPSEDSNQLMGSVYLFYARSSSCAPNLDKQGLWDLTNACGFPPADDGEDLICTFEQWNYSGSGEITWNEFVREITDRINCEVHYLADPLPETM